MSLDIQQREREGVFLLDLDGRLTAGSEVTSFRSIVDKLNDAPGTRIILNLERVDYIDSTGLGAMVYCSTAARRSGGAIKLLNLNRRNIELLVTTKLSTIFEIFTDEQDAISSFFPDRKVKTFDILEFVKGLKEEA